MRLFRYVLFFALFVTFVGCATYKRCTTRFPCYGDTVRLEMIRDSIVYKDKTIVIKLPGETAIDSVFIPCPDPGPAYVPKKVHAETSLAYADAWFQFPNIKLVLVQKDTTIERRLDDAIKESYYWKTIATKVTIVPKPVKVVPKFVKFLAWVGGLFIFAVIGYVLVKIFNPFKILG
jgi:hypothetical protein